jgi:hypothetical protein
MAGFSAANYDKGNTCAAAADDDPCWKVVIQSGSNCTVTCSDYWRPNMMLSSNPWDVRNSYATKGGVGDDHSNSTLQVYNEHKLEDNQGKVVVLTDNNENLVACGVLQKAEEIIP